MIGKLAVSAALMLARPAAAQPLIDAPGLPPRIALLALAHPEAGAEELRGLVRGLLDEEFAVVLAFHDAASLAPLLDLIAVTPALMPVACSGEGAFSLWQSALSAIGLPRENTRAALLLSTRLAGPVAPFAGLLARTSNFAEADLWGLTESWTGQYHLPSCWFSVGPRALAHPSWRAFWAALPAFPNHPAVVQHLEVALTQTLLEAGLTAASAYPYAALLDRADQAYAAFRASPPTDDVGRARATHLRRIRTLQANRTPMEPLNFFWQELLELGAPFVARELLARNPHGVVTARDCVERLRAKSVAAA
jgi:hypothetical protein